jgi:predicted lipase
MLLFNDNLLRSALASKISYSDNCKIVTKSPISLQLQGVKNNISCKIVDNNNTGAHVYCWESGNNSKLIAFRGSHDLKDIINFMKFGMNKLNIRNSSVKIHSNIFNMFHSLETELTDYIMKDYSKKTITFCGHSAGGNIAMLAAAYYGDLTGDNVEIKCHTFGTPKFADKYFSEWYLDNVDESINIINEHDFVRYIPFHYEYHNIPNQYILKDNNIDFLKAHDLDTYNDLIVAKLRNPPHISR